MLKSAVLMLLSQVAVAQTDMVVPEITVTGAAQPSVSVPAASELSGSRLERKKQATIGETLGREAGVASSEFGQSASRPVVRGQEGDRVKILQNGTGVVDASGASQDHAVAVEPLSIDKVEIVRGPGALLYGSNAVGGVVNMTTNRIPEKRPPARATKFDTRFSSVDLGRSFGVSGDSTLGQSWATHLDASVRASDDYHVNSGKRIENSFNRTDSTSVGASYVKERGYLGTALSDYSSKYGTIVEKFTHIDLLQQRWDVEGEIRDLGFLQSLRARNSYSHYRHNEIAEGGQLGTSFKNDGDQARIEARHKPFGIMNGILGAEVSTSRFAAEGEEAFVPTTDSLASSVFAFEELQDVFLKPTLALRFDRSGISSRDDAKFGPGQNKNFSALSAAVGTAYKLLSTDSIALNLAYTERAPSSEELFANGPHAATAQFEQGDKQLGKERSQSVEAVYKAHFNSARFTVSAFAQDYQSYVSLAPTGATDPTSTFPIFAYRAVNARFLGAEIESRFKLPDWIPGGVLELEVKGDFLRAYNRATGENLPRITPIRETVGLIYKADRFTADIEAQRSEKQSLTAPFETATGAYTWLNLGTEVPIKTDRARFNVIVRVHNVFDVEAKNHVSVIKDAAPLPGRNFTLGLQAAF